MESAVVAAVRTVIEANKVALVAGLSNGAVPVEIKSITSTLLSVPSAYMALVIDCQGVSYRKFSGANATRNAIRVAVYQMTIGLSDYAVMTQGETDFGLTAHNNFRLVADRIVDLLLQTRFYPDEASKPRFCILMDSADSPRVERENQDISDPETGDYILGTTIRFSLVNPNVDREMLYT